MYSAIFFAPVFVTSCIYNFLNQRGDYCVIDQPKPSVIKYYEAGKSCYVNGTFYSKCEERLNGTKQ